MRTKALTIIGVLLIAGSSVQVASASEKHVRKVHRVSAPIQDQWNFRDAYNAPLYYYIPQGLEAVRERNRQNFGFGGWDPSRPGDFDPSLRPSD
jgi:hypothetical protein